MTILQALAERYERLAEEGKAPVAGFAPAQLSFAIVLNPDGGVVAVDDLRTADKKRRPTSHEAPQPPKRTAGIASGLFWDKTSYVLGRTAPDPKLSNEKAAKAAARTADEHAAFKKRHELLLAGSADPGLLALHRFLAGWAPERYEQLAHAPDMLDQNVAFRLDGDLGFIHDRQAAREALQPPPRVDDKGTGFCLVTGSTAPIARLHPSIKGIPGAQSSGAALVSFNLDAFNSYGKMQGFNAPVSEAAAFAYATALNDLVSASMGVDPKGRPRWSNRIGLSGDTVVFWAETDAAERAARDLLDPPPDDDTETDAVRTKLTFMEDGRAIRDLAPEVDPTTRVYVLGLSPNAARLSVRFWLDQSFGDFARHMLHHWHDLRIEPAPRGGPQKLWALLYEIAPLRKPDRGTQHIAGEMTRAILSGGLYPASLLTQAVMRVRAEKEKTTPNRVALIKAVLARRARKADPQWKDTLVALDRDEPNVGYRLGRLFAVLEAAQYAGVGAVNAGVKDKFFSSASATPGHIFPLLLRGAQDHLSAARKKGKGGRAHRLEGEMREILDGVSPRDAFPRTLALEDQGRFVIGFYHQDADLRVPRVKNEEVEVQSADTATEADEDAR